MAWRRSYARRTGAERGFATAKDPATNDINRGWCRLTGPAPLMLFTTTLLIVRNQRILSTWDARQAENARRAAAGLPPKTRKRRRKTLTVLTTATRPPSAGEHAAAPTAPATNYRATPGHPHADSGSTPRNHPGHTVSQQADTNRAQSWQPQHAHRNVRPKRENRPH